MGLDMALGPNEEGMFLVFKMSLLLRVMYPHLKLLNKPLDLVDL